MPSDLTVAQELYALAAQDTQLRQTTYIPDGGSVRAETTYLGKEKGLEEAAERLARLQGVLDAKREARSVQEVEGS